MQWIKRYLADSCVEEAKYSINPLNRAHGKRTENRTNASRAFNLSGFPNLCLTPNLTGTNFSFASPRCSVLP